jgi:hypothetical protein
VDEPSGITLGALTFTAGPLGPNNFIFVLGPDVYGFGTSAISAQGYLTDADDDLNIALSGSATAVAFDFIVDPGAITVNFSDGTSDSFAASVDPPASIFLGITAPGGITSVDIAEPFSLGTASLNLIDFTTASIPAVSPGVTPEPESLALVFTGLAGLAGALRTRLVRRP